MEIADNVTIGRGALIGDGVRLGRGVKVPEFSRIGRERWRREGWEEGDEEDEDDEILESEYCPLLQDRPKKWYQPTLARCVTRKYLAAAVDRGGAQPD